VANYRRDLAHLAQAAGGRALTEFGASEVRRAVAQLHGQGLGPASLARLLSAWRGFFHWLGQRGELAANPAAGVRAPRRPKHLPKALSADQAVSLATFEGDGSWLARRDHALVELLYSSGLRLAELVSLDWRAFPAGEGAAASESWIDLDAAEATVTGKGRKQRSVPVGAAAAQALRAWLAVRAERARPAERALFVSERGTRLAARSVQLRLARLAREAGLGVPVHPHVLRHSFASHLLQSSGDLRAVQELLGHANIATTQIYTRLDWQHLARAYDAAHPRAKRKS
jgi:integrase/recombinase XerC